MNRRPSPPPEPTRLETAYDRLTDAQGAIERGRLDEALEAVLRARTIIETELQFRRARRAQA